MVFRVEKLDICLEQRPCSPQETTPHLQLLQVSDAFKAPSPHLVTLFHAGDGYSNLRWWYVGLCVLILDWSISSSKVRFFSSVAQSCLTLRPHGLQHTRLPCPSPTLGVYSNSWHWWCHPTISSSVIPFSSCLQSFPASGSFPMSPFFASGGQNIGVSASASVLPMNIQDWFNLG